MVFRYIVRLAARMKLSRSNSQSQGENNRETCPTYPRSRCPVPQHFSDSNGRARRWRRNWWRLPERNHLQTVIVKVCMKDLGVEPPGCRSYKNRTRSTTTLSPAASRCIVHSHGYAAGALIALALSVGRAQPPSAGFSHLPVET